MGGRHVIVVLELVVRHDGGHILGQGFVQLVIYPGVVLGVNGRQKQQQKHRQKLDTVADNKAIDLVKAGNQGAVPVPFNLPVKYQKQGRQHKNDGGHAQHHALGHDNADVPSQGELHEAQSRKARNGGQRAAGKRAEGRHNGLGHGVPPVLMPLTLLPIAMVEENGVVHGDTQLEHRRDGLSDIRNLPHKYICAKIIEDGHADAGKEHKGQHGGFQRHRHRRQGQHHRQRHIDGQLPVHQVLGVLDDHGESG